jgi:hypothetical protein
MSDLIRLSGTTVNAPDAIALARFYAEITGGVAKGDEHWALVEGPHGDIGFQQVDDHRPPTWPDPEVAMQMHLEFFVDELEATGARVLAAGATQLDHQPLHRVRRPGRASVLPVDLGSPESRRLTQPCPGLHQAQPAARIAHGVAHRWRISPPRESHPLDRAGLRHRGIRTLPPRGY